MGLLLILPILVSGYIFCSGSVYRQATLNRYDGQLLYMLIARMGIFVFTFASIASFALMYASSHELLKFMTVEYADYVKYLKSFLIRYEVAEEKTASLWVFFGQATVLAFIIAWMCPRLYTLLIMLKHRLGSVQAKAFILSWMVPSRPLTRQLLTSMSDKASQYMFSMTDRKVYIGRVSSVGDLHEAGSMDDDFEIVPVMSGYRDKDTLRVSYTTDYSAVVEDMAEKGRRIGFTIVLSQKNIVSISRFEYEIWERFKSHQARSTGSKADLLTRWCDVSSAP